MQQQHIAIPRPVPGRASAGRLAVVTIGLALVSSVAALAQGAAPAEPERRTVTVGHYSASGPKRLVWGSGYRDLWMTPVSVEVLDFANEAGGLRPARRVGGQQTRVLALEGRDGRSYRFRGAREGHLPPARLLRPAAAEHHGREDARRPDVGAAPGERARGARHPRGGRGPGPALAARRAARRPRARGVPQGVRGRGGRLRGVPAAREGRAPGFLGATEIIDHQELYKRLEAGDAAADTAGAAAGAARGHAHGRLGPPPAAVALGDDERAARCSCRSPRIATRRSRATRATCSDARGHATRASRNSVLATGIGGLTFNGWEQDRRLLAGFSREEFVETAKELPARLTDAAIERRRAACRPSGTRVDGARLVADLRRAATRCPTRRGSTTAPGASRVDVYMTNRSERVLARRLATATWRSRCARSTAAGRRRRPSTACSTRARRRKCASTRSEGTTRSP